MQTNPAVEQNQSGRKGKGQPGHPSVEVQLVRTKAVHIINLGSSPFSHLSHPTKG